jgi:hypothetical protein
VRDGCGGLGFANERMTSRYRPLAMRLIATP